MMPGGDEYCPARDGRESYDLCLVAKREMGVRTGEISPMNATEARQREDGPCAWADLDCVAMRDGAATRGTALSHRERLEDA